MVNEPRNLPMSPEDGVMDIAKAIIFSLLTCGIYALYWIYTHDRLLH